MINQFTLAGRVEGKVNLRTGEKNGKKWFTASFILKFRAEQMPKPCNIRVVAFSQTGRQVAAELSSGEYVLIQGQLRTRSWKKDGEEDWREQSEVWLQNWIRLPVRSGALPIKDRHKSTDDQVEELLGDG